VSLLIVTQGNNHEMNSDGLNSKNIVNCVNAFNDVSLLIVTQGNNHEMNSVSCECS
jgi:hypothetical protein